MRLWVPVGRRGGISFGILGGIFVLPLVLVFIIFFVWPIQIVWMLTVILIHKARQARRQKRFTQKRR